MQHHPPSFSTRPLATLALLAALLALPMNAHAGTPHDPEVEDDALDAGAGEAWADIDAAWVEQPAPDLVRFTLRIMLLPEAIFGTAYGFVFDAEGKTFVAGLAAIPDAQFVLGTWDRETQKVSIIESLEGSYTTGMGGLVTVDVPLRMLPENTTTLAALGAMTLDIKPEFMDAGVVMLDKAEGNRDFALLTAEEPEANETAPVEPAAEGSGGAGKETPAAAAESATPAGGTPAVSEPAAKEAPAPAFALLVAAAVAVALARRR